MKIISFYLPQFHAIPENDEWWGEGFTEWVNVKNGKPLFKEHYQPVEPLNNNYYNLLDDNVKKWQIELAKNAGIYGFCFYHYWFDGHLMLEKPIEQYLENKNLDFPFCLCWANPPWTKVWAGKGSEVLIGQNYGNEPEWETHFQYLLPYFKDERYIKEDGCPLLVIYEPATMTRLEEFVSFLRKRIIEEGFNGIKLAYQYYVTPEVDKKIRPIFDYCIEFQPVYGLTKLESGEGTDILKKINSKIDNVFGIRLSDLRKKLRITNYDTLWKTIIDTKPLDKKSLPGAFVNWDNTPRRGSSGRVVLGGNPEKFQNYMVKQIKNAKEEYCTEYLFVTAWNEWSEGSYLEPDKKNGAGYLDAIKNALKCCGEVDNS